jgi:hypothetical protein
VSHRAELYAPRGSSIKRSSKMSALIDDLSRIAASPIPRRQAFRLLGRVLSGGILASLGFARPVSGQGEQVNTCIDGQVPCGSTCCYPYETCCGGTCYGAEVSAAYNCCGGVLCAKVSQQCCTNHCCRKSQTCCGLQCCAPGQTCCRNQCCAPGAVCCGSTCCPEGYVCCRNKCVPKRPSASSPCTA